MIGQPPWPRIESRVNDSHHRDGIVGLGDITKRHAIISAIEECDRLGREAFLAKYGFKHARNYMLRWQGRNYDSKAIVVVAHGYEHPDLGPLKSAEFNGGTNTIQRKLEALGFEVVVLRVPDERPTNRQPAAATSAGVSLVLHS